MSSTVTTPSRHGRGFGLPDIDTRARQSKPATALNFGGWPTPPQSAQESRRESLDNAMHADMQSFGTHATNALSMSATPVHLVGHPHDAFRHQWSQQTNHTDGQLDDHFENDPFQEETLRGAMQPSQCLSVETAPLYSTPSRIVGTLGLDMSIGPTSTDDEWMHHGQSSGLDNVGLRPALFQTGQESYGNHSHSVQPLSLDTMAAVRQHGFQDVSSNFAQPQVVVPSQLSPADDWQMVQYPEYSALPHDMTPGLVSASSSFSSFEFPGPHTPTDDYGWHSEEEGYVAVKPEPLASPTPGGSWQGIAKSIPLRARRKSSKRGKSKIPRAFWSNTAASCEVHVEGRWHFNQDGFASIEKTPASKPHVCHCGSRFERSEHLKRHQKMHGDGEFPCMLPGCEGRLMTRGDNCTDHFKTHLKDVRKGHRNKPYSLPVVKQSISDSYSIKIADKLIGKLEKACRDDRDLAVTAQQFKKQHQYVGW